jgi:hypothetical protein
MKSFSNHTSPAGWLTFSLGLTRTTWAPKWEAHFSKTILPHICGTARQQHGCLVSVPPSAAKTQYQIARQLGKSIMALPPGVLVFRSRPAPHAQSSPSRKPFRVRILVPLSHCPSRPFQSSVQHHNAPADVRLHRTNISTAQRDQSDTLLFCLHDDVLLRKVLQPPY